MDRRQNTVLEVKTAAWTDYIAGPIVCPKLEDAVGPRIVKVPLKLLRDYFDLRCVVCSRSQVQLSPDSLA